jgi:hypothetical protein
MKTNFNIVCNSTIASSFIGDIYDAQYFVNLGVLLDNENDYKKQFKVSLRFKCPQDADIQLSQTYICSLIINSRVNTQQNLNTSYTLAILDKINEDPVDGFLSLNCSPYDNPYIIINGLDRIDRIGLRFNILETAGLFVGMPNYIAIINFEEV